MDQENKIRYQVINELKKKYSIRPLKGFYPDLLNFNIINKGADFKQLYTWEIIDFSFKTFLCSIRNSFEIESLNNYYYFSSNKKQGRYFYLLIETNKILPNLIIRPSYFNDKIGDFFLNFDVKIKGFKKFNRSFVLETNSKKESSIILTKEFIENISEEKNLYLEINDGKVLLKFEKGQEINDVNRLIEIGFILDKIIKNVA